MRLIIAGGGTGGHLYPGMAVAEEVKGRGGEVLFVGTTRGIEARVVPAAGYPLELLEVSGIKRMGLWRTLQGLGRVPLAVGGSQGARAVNDLVIEAAQLLAAQGALPPLVHQTGAKDADRCLERYRALELAARVSVRPFIENMAETLAEADLVVGRAGALTLAELAIVGRPAVLIPLPTAADDHQS